MKKILAVLLFTALVSCNGTFTEVRPEYISIENKVYYEGYAFFTIEMDGHSYLVATNGLNYGGGIGICHSESCKCKTDNEKATREN